MLSRIKQSASLWFSKPPMFRSSKFGTYTGSILQTLTYWYLLIDAGLSAYLKKTIKHNERVIYQLRIERRVIDNESDINAISSSTESLLYHKEVNIVLDLARAMRKQEAVPQMRGQAQPRRADSSGRQRQQERPRAEASEQEHEEERRRSREERQRLERIQEEAQTAEPSERPRRFEERAIVERDQQRRETKNHSMSRRWAAYQLSRYNGSRRLTPNSSLSGSMNTPGSGPLSRRIAEDHGLNESPRGSLSETVSRENQENTAVRPPATSPTDSSAGSSQVRRFAIREGSDFMRVRALSNILKMEASRSAQRVQGYIEDGDGRQRSVTAILEQVQAFNFMTTNKASELSLLGSIELYTGEEEVETWIESVDGRRIEPVGKIQVLWSMRQQSPLGVNAFSLEFWVFSYHQERDLVLGEPFISKRNYYLRSRPL